MRQRMPGFRQLCELHLAHQADRQAAREQDRLRAAITALDEQLAGARGVLAAAEAEQARLQSEKRAADGEVQRLEQVRAKYRSQLMEAKTNEVYKTLLHEIETTTTGISDRETVILEIMEALDAAKAAVTEAGKELKAAEIVVGGEAGKLEAQVAELQARREAAQARAAGIEPEVPRDLLARYRRVAAGRGDIGMSRVDGSECSTCKVGVRPQVIVELASREDLYDCPGCGRILFTDANLQVDSPQPEVAPASGTGEA